MKHTSNQLGNQYDIYQKANYIVSYPNIEFEAKIAGMLKQEDILKELHRNNLRIDDVVKRKEFHHFYQKGSIQRTFIFSRGSEMVWIKEKNSGDIAYTSVLQAPVLIRRERKLEPTKNREYRKYFLGALSYDFRGSLEKNAVDISFWFEEFLFTITPMMSKMGKRILLQTEIEYNGHSRSAQRPAKNTIINVSSIDYLNERIEYWSFDVGNATKRMIPAHSYHRTVGSMHNALTQSKFFVEKILEPKPTMKKGVGNSRAYKIAKGIPETIIFVCKKYGGEIR